MLKHDVLERGLGAAAVEALRALLVAVPAIKIEKIEQDRSCEGREIDIVADLTAFGRKHRLVCEVKNNGQPRHARMALLQLRDWIAHAPASRPVTPVFMSTYLSPDVQALCQNAEVGFLDLEGNARIVFDGVFIQRSVASKPAAQRRDLKSIFKPKSAQVLRVMLREPEKAWRVVELAEASGVSLGQISNVRSGLVDREWASVVDEGLKLSAPDRLLDAWREAYERPAGEACRFYTTLHGPAFDAALRHCLQAATKGEGGAILASFSAARWLAPFARTGTQHFYADPVGLDRLQEALKLSSASRGENVAIVVTREEGVFRDAIEPAIGIYCTSPVQTYLDLHAAGERGREAAEHLRAEKLIWSM